MKLFYKDKLLTKDVFHPYLNSEQDLDHIFIDLYHYVNVDIEEIRNKYPRVIHPDLSAFIYKSLEKEFYNYIFKYKNNLL